MNFNLKQYTAFKNKRLTFVVVCISSVIIAAILLITFIKSIAFGIVEDKLAEYSISYDNITYNIFTSTLEVDNFVYVDTSPEYMLTASIGSLFLSKPNFFALNSYDVTQVFEQLHVESANVEIALADNSILAVSISDYYLEDFTTRLGFITDEHEKDPFSVTFFEALLDSSFSISEIHNFSVSYSDYYNSKFLYEVSKMSQEWDSANNTFSFENFGMLLESENNNVYLTADSLSLQSLAVPQETQLSSLCTMLFSTDAYTVYDFLSVMQTSAKAPFSYFEIQNITSYVSSWYDELYASIDTYSIDLSSESGNILDGNDSVSINTTIDGVQVYNNVLYALIPEWDGLFDVDIFEPISINISNTLNPSTLVFGGSTTYFSPSAFDIKLEYNLQFRDPGMWSYVLLGTSFHALLESSYNSNAILENIYFGGLAVSYIDSGLIPSLITLFASSTGQSYDVAQTTMYFGLAILLAALQESEYDYYDSYDYNNNSFNALLSDFSDALLTLILEQGGITLLYSSPYYVPLLEFDTYYENGLISANIFAQ